MSIQHIPPVACCLLKTNGLAVILITAMTITSANAADETEAPVKRELVMKCGSLIDGISDDVLESKTLTIRDGLIVSITDTRPENSVDLDLSGYTCLPGLINTHVHFDANPEDAADYGVYARRTQEDNLALILKNAATTVHSGFTTVRHAGAWFPDTLAMAKAKIDASEAIGPRIQSAGPYLTIRGGGGDLRFPEIPADKIPTESQQGIASTPEEFAKRAKKAITKKFSSSKVLAKNACSGEILLKIIHAR